MNKSFLLELCERLEDKINNLHEQIIDNKCKHKIEIKSQLKPTEIRETWFVELYFDGNCIIMESYLPKEDEYTEDKLSFIESLLIKKMIVNIFCHGIMSCKRDIEKLQNKIWNKKNRIK